MERCAKVNAKSHTHFKSAHFHFVTLAAVVVVTMGISLILGTVSAELELEVEGVPVSVPGHKVKVDRRVMNDLDLSESGPILSWMQKEREALDGGGGWSDDDAKVDADDPECPQGQWWHLRGQRCVPNKCRGGNKMRNHDTGECIRKSGRRYKDTSPIYYFSRSSLRRFKSPHRFYRGMSRMRG